MTKYESIGYKDIKDEFVKFKVEFDVISVDCNNKFYIFEGTLDKDYDIPLMATIISNTGSHVYTISKIERKERIWKFWTKLVSQPYSLRRLRHYHMRIKWFE